MCVCVCEREREGVSVCRLGVWPGVSDRKREWHYHIYATPDPLL